METAFYYSATFTFLAAFIVEMLVTGKLFLHRENLPVTGFMRWWAVVSLGAMSVVNLLGWLRLRSNYAINEMDVGNVLQALFALFGLSLVTWVWIFHLKKWGSTR